MPTSSNTAPKAICGQMGPSTHFQPRNAPLMPRTSSPMAPATTRNAPKKSAENIRPKAGDGFVFTKPVTSA